MEIMLLFIANNATLMHVINAILIKIYQNLHSHNPSLNQINNHPFNNNNLIINHHSDHHIHNLNSNRNPKTKRI